MNTKLTSNICYIAGLVSKSKQAEKNAVGIRTSIGEIEQRFIKIAITELEIEPSKILIEELEGHRHVYFYHSRVAKRLEEIYSREIHVFKKIDKLSASYVAGMFDGAGRVRSTTMTITPISPNDAFMLENLGVHTRGNEILNIGNFMKLIGKESVMIQRVSADLDR